MKLIGKTIEQVEKEKLDKQNKIKIEENLRYLQETDWYVSRLTETGVIIPEEILLKRQQARELISSIRISLLGE